MLARVVYLPYSQVIEEDGLQANSDRVGEVMLRGMLALRDEFEIVGDVRGTGLMLGMELVKNKVRYVFWSVCVCTFLLEPCCPILTHIVHWSCASLL